MRDETQQFETVLHGLATRLERAGGMPVADVVLHMRAMKRFMANCTASGCEADLVLAMERAGLGDLTEALLPLVR